MLECLKNCWKNVSEHAKIYWKQISECPKIVFEKVEKKFKKVEKIDKNVFRKFQNMMYQNNDLKKTLIKSNKATKN